MSSTLTIGGKTVQDITIGAKQVKSIYDNTHQVLLWERAEPNYFYFEDRSGADNSISIAKTGDEAEWLALEYSNDKETWNTWDFSQALTLPANGKVYLRGDNTAFRASVGNYYSFKSTNNVYAGGIVRSLFNKNVPDTINSNPNMFASMFLSMQTLVGVDTNLFKGINYVGDMRNMFNATFMSTNIVTPPDLSDIPTVGTGTFRDTFAQCSLLETAPAINVKETVNGTANQFRSTFYQCYALVDASPMRVSSTNANSTLFYGTFTGCNNLVVPPDLTGVTVLGKQRMYRCFYGCSSLTSIKVGFTQWGSDVETDANYQSTKEWTYDINTNGVFIAPSTLPKTRNSADNTTTSDFIPTNWSIADLNGKLYAPVITNNNNTITIAEAEGGASCQIFYTVDGSTPTPENGTLYTQPFTVGSGVTVKAIAHYNGNRADLITDSDVAWLEIPIEYFYIENLSDSANTVTLPKTGDKTEWVELEYSLDKTNWDKYDLETGVSVPVGGKLYLRGNNNQLCDSVSGSTTKHSFVSDGNIKAGGKAISLLSKDLSKTSIDYWFAFSCLFQNNTKLINTETTLFDGFDLNNTYTFQYIFDGCTNLQDVCSFSGVKTLKQSSFIRAYRNCTGITNASGFLPNATSTSGNQTFYETFSHCTSLTIVPNFSNITIGTGTSTFNGTFYGCTSITTPAAMSQTAVNVIGTHKFYQMYKGCTNLQKSPNISIATETDNMLTGIFYNCSNIDYINIEFSAWDGATEFTRDWVINVHPTGVFCKNATLPVTRGIDYIPTNWSIADLNGKLYAPVITNTDNTITIAEAEGGASCQIFYTVDGSIPTPENGTLYTQPFTVGSGVTVKAIAHYNGNRADLITDSDVAWLERIPSPTLTASGAGKGQGSETTCSGEPFHTWTIKMKTTGSEGVTYYLNWLNADNADTFPENPTTTAYDDTATYSGQIGCVEADSECKYTVTLCDADMVGLYVNFIVVGVKNGFVSDISILSIENPNPIQ